MKTIIAAYLITKILQMKVAVLWLTITNLSTNLLFNSVLGRKPSELLPQMALSTADFTSGRQVVTLKFAINK